MKPSSTLRLWADCLLGAGAVGALATAALHAREHETAATICSIVVFALILASAIVGNRSTDRFREELRRDIPALPTRSDESR